MGLIKKIKQYGKGKIIIEIPTYPYYKEFKSGLPQITLLIDKILSKGLKKHVDRITTYSKHETIFNIPTIQILNGVECSLIPIKTITIRDDKELNLIAVANFYKWHGYERLIEGLHNHYKQELSQKVRLHFVGDGPEFNLYKNLIMQYNLSQYVTFHGILSGEKLTEVFDKVDIAINSLGSHRIGIHLSSALKSREYLARGMPMVSSTKIDILPEGFKYCLYVPEDESPIDIQTMVEFYQSLLAVKSISEVSYEIRRFAENNCDMSITMKPVIDYLSRV
jgi:glycosyltransferase involved in cell wall biosynthesis